MIGIRHSEDRGSYDHGSLKSFHTFSFGEYQDPEHKGFGPLTVINEDCLQPGAGFPDHPHKEVEVVSYVIEGKLRYRDDLGNKFLLSAGDAQVASCGTGITHSVYNAAEDALLRIYQFHIIPPQVVK